jgi:nucleoside-diphosphate-sugar epimerase
MGGDPRCGLAPRRDRQRAAVIGKVLITGGAGFIGGFLAKALAESGARVHVLDNFSRGRPDAFLRGLQDRHGIEILSYDLCEPPAIERLPRDYQLIFHLAAILGVQNVVERPYATLRDNATLLAHVIELARRQGSMERFLFTSTSEVYAGSLLHLQMPVPTPESFPLALPALEQPRTSYMLSKIYGEAMVAHSGVPFTIFRPHNIYGPRMGRLHVIPQLLEKAHKAEPGSAIEVFSVDHRRTFCYVDDAVAMMVAAAQSPNCRDQVLNLGCEKPEIAIGELARIIIDVVHKPLTIKAAPATAGSPARRAPNMERMTAATGLAARVPIEDGVRQTYDWYRSHVFSGMEAEVAR